MLKVRCPVCQREMTGERKDWPQFPFCGRRCKLVDLGRWLNGDRYGVPVEPAQADGGEIEDDRELPPAGQSSGRSS